MADETFRLPACAKRTGVMNSKASPTNANLDDVLPRVMVLPLFAVGSMFSNLFVQSSVMAKKVENRTKVPHGP